MDDEALIAACLAPVVARIRGRGLDVKATEHGELAPAQRALLGFHVLHAHARDLTSFWAHVRLFAVEWDVWSRLEDSARYFTDDPLLAVYRKLWAVAHAASDRDHGVAAALYDAYQAAAGNSVRVAAEHIRADPRRFVRLS